MPVTLTNRMLSGPLIVPLSSGAAVRLSPGQTSPELPDVEAEANAALDKLVGRGWVEVRRRDGDAEPEAEPESEPAPGAEAGADAPRSRGGRRRAKDAGDPGDGQDAPASGDS